MSTQMSNARRAPWTSVRTEGIALPVGGMPRAEAFPGEDRPTQMPLSVVYLIVLLLAFPYYLTMGLLFVACRCEAGASRVSAAWSRASRAFGR